MIEATPGVKKQALSPEPLGKPPLPRAEAEDREGRTSGGAPEVQVAERQKQVTAASPSFDVRLDGETMRLYSELRDPETNRVIMRLPAGYQPTEEQQPEQPRISTQA